MVEKIICQGCGVIIQTEDPKRLGYAPPSSLDREDVICKRCFRLKHYNEVADVQLSDDDFLKMLDTIGLRKGLVVKIVDIFDFNGSFLPALPRFVGKNPIILVGNKVDLLPKSVNHNKVKNWLKKAAKDFGVKVEEVFLVSAKKGIGMDEAAKGINHYRHGRDVYVVGATNVGKSTFINYLIQRTTGKKDAITTSYFPGTTLGFIDIPLDEHTSMYDTPGIINRHQMAHYISEKDLRIITPKKEIKAKVYQLNSNQTLFFGGLGRLDFIRGDRTSFTCYFSNDLGIHRTKLEKADELYEKHIGELLSPPGEETLKILPPLKGHTFSIKEKSDIVFSGLGWVTVNNGGITVKAYIPEGVSVLIRDSLI
jgi:30S ribosome assembly GTPase